MIGITEEKYQEIAQKATRGMGWNIVAFGGTKILTLITLFVLAHILPPENFGLVALATLTMDYFSIISDLGFGAALIQKKESVEKSANIAFGINLIANILLTVIIFIIAPWTASFFREPVLTPVLRWLGLTFFIKSIGSIQNVLLQRDLDFKKKLIPELTGSIVKMIVSVGMAWLGYGVWSLVAGQLIGTAISSVLLWYLSPWRPKFEWENSTAKKLFIYGFSIMGSNALTVWEDNFDYLIVGRIFDTAALGIYSVAYRLPETLILNTLWLMTAVIFPTFSSLQDDKDSLKRGFLSTVRYVELLAVPACFGMVVTADPLIRVAFGEQWVEAIPILQVICLYTLLVSVGFHAGDVYKAIGRPDLLLKLSLPLFPIRLLALWIGAQYGLLGVAFGHLAAEIISTVIAFAVIKRMLDVSFMEILKELKAFVGGTALLVFAVPVMLYSKDLLPIIRLIAITMAGGIGYTTTMWMIDRETSIRFLGLLGLSKYVDKYSTKK